MDWVKEKVLKYKWYMIILLVSILCFGYMFYKPKISEIEQISQNIVKDKMADTIFIDIKGAVNSPGVYKIPINSRVEDALLVSGGLRDDADTSIINLSQKVNDADVIVIYTVGEVLQMQAKDMSVIENECVCPKINNIGCIDKKSDDVSKKFVSINEGSIEELLTLPGIGNSKASLIVDYRVKNGGFKELEDLKKVKGIGDAIFDKLKDYIML